MAIRIGSNIAALQVQRRLSQTRDVASSSMERLSSGMRINRAADDAAGLAISSALLSQSAIQGKAIRNIGDGLSLLNIAQGALQNLASLTERQEELLIQASNGTYSATQRVALGREARALTDEFNRIVEVTCFNGRRLLAGSNTEEVSFQVGASSTEWISIPSLSVEAQTTTAGSGTFATAQSFAIGNGPEFIHAADVDGDGNVDVFTADTLSNNISYLRGNGDGTFKARISIATGASSAPRSVTTGDVNKDGLLDLITADTGTSTIDVFLGNGDGTFKNKTSLTGNLPYQALLADFNMDGNVDIITTDNTTTLSLFLGNGNGTFQARTMITKTGAVFSISVADFNNDGLPDVATGNRVHIGNGDGTFRLSNTVSLASDPRVRSVGDMNNDGILDLILGEANTNTVVVVMGNGDGTFRVGTTLPTGANSSPRAPIVLDLNGDGKNDLLVPFGGGSAPYPSTVLSYFGNGDGTFLAPSTITTAAQRPKSIVAADVNKDGVADLLTADTLGNSISVLLANTTTVNTGRAIAIDVSSRSAIFDSLDTVRQARDRVANKLSVVGAAQSRLQTALANVQVNRINAQAAASRIMDADIAKESAQMVASQVSLDVAASVFAQAKQQPSVVLSLLR